MAQVEKSVKSITTMSPLREGKEIPFDHWKKLQRKIRNRNTRAFEEFHTIPKLYVKAYQSLLLDHAMPGKSRDSRVGALMREINLHGIGFEVVEEKARYLTRTINYQSGLCHYTPRRENNRLFLFYLAYQNVITDYRVDNDTDVVKMRFMLKNNRDCEAIILPNNVKRSNQIMKESEEKRRKAVQMEEMELADLKEAIGKEIAPVQMGYDVFYIAIGLDFAKKLELDNIAGHLVFPNQTKNPNLQWCPELKAIPYYVNTSIQAVNQLKKKGVNGIAHSL